MLFEVKYFSPSRGEDLSEAQAERNKATPPPRFELIGICTIGDNSGAIIDLKMQQEVIKEIKFVVIMRWEPKSMVDSFWKVLPINQ